MNDNPDTRSSPEARAQRFALRLPNPLLDLIRELAKEQDTSVTTLITLLLAASVGYRGTGAPTPADVRHAAKSLRKFADQLESKKGPLVA